MRLANFLKNILILLSITVSSVKSYVYMFTRMGDVFRTSDGSHFSLISNTGYNNAVSLVFISNNLGYLLISNGDILRTSNNGENWQLVSAIPVNDAVDLLFAGGYFYVLTSSGDVFRGSDIGSMTLISSITDNNFVSLANDGGYIFALTSLGDVWRSGDGYSWQLVGSTGSTDMVDVVEMNDTLYAVNRYGDIFRSVDNGINWIMTETVSQIGVVDMQVTEDGLMLLCFNTGELMKKSEKGWQYIGTASQIGVLGLSASGTPTFIGDTSGIGLGLKLKVQPIIASRILKISSGPGEVSIYTVDGRIVKSLNKRAGEVEIDVRDIKTGIYFVKYGAESVRFLKF